MSALTVEETEALINAGASARVAIESLTFVQRRTFERLYFCDPSPGPKPVLDELVSLGLAEHDDEEGRYVVTWIAHMARSVAFDERGRRRK